MHRQEGQKIARSDDAEHVAEVGAGAHANVLDDVRENAPSLPDAVFQHEETFFQQDNVGRFFGHIHGRIHRNSDIRRFECRGVVDAVTLIPDNVTGDLQLPDDLFLLVRRQSREDVRFFYRFGKRVLR